MLSVHVAGKRRDGATGVLLAGRCGRSAVAPFGYIDPIIGSNVSGYECRLADLESRLKSRCHPVPLDPDTGIDSAREIREYLVADFSRWKEHDAYAAEFEKLVRGSEGMSVTRTRDRHLGRSDQS